MGHLDIIECESAEAALLIGGRKHEPMHLEGREGDCEEKVPMAADNAYRAKAWECLSLAECMNDPDERAEIVRFAWMWMSLAEPIDEARGSYEFPRGR
jgi:hypothetical protein